MKFSIVIPCFNGGEYAADAVNSVLSQQVADTEIILVDDKSTDNSLEILQQLAAIDPAIVRVIALAENRGPGTARNAGLKAARGEYVGFLDVDDSYGPRVFETALRYLDTMPWIAAVKFSVRLINNHRSDCTSQHLASLEASIPSNMIVRTEIARLIGGFPESQAFRTIEAGEDSAFRTMLRRFHLTLADETAFVNYRVRRGSHFDNFLDQCKIVAGELDLRPLPAASAQAAISYYSQTWINRVGKVKGASYFEVLGGHDGPRVFYTYRNPISIEHAKDILEGRTYPIPPIDVNAVRQVLDIGAHIGAAAVLFGNIFPKANINAFEPDPDSYQLLMHNVGPCHQINAYNYGLFDQTGTADLHQGVDDRITNSLYPNVLTGGRSRSVQILNIAKLFNNFPFDVIKIDTEGAEVPIISAAPEIFQHAKVLYVEYHSETDRRWVDSLVGQTHILAHCKATTPHRGELMYVRNEAFQPSYPRDYWEIRI